MFRTYKLVTVFKAVLILVPFKVHINLKMCVCLFQTGALRLANCNLHTAAVGEGISAVLQDVIIAQFIEQQEAVRLGLPPPLLRRSNWLEAGSVTFNLITADVALAADHPAKYEVQRHFLELHDTQTKRCFKCYSENMYPMSTECK